MDKHTAPLDTKQNVFTVPSYSNDAQFSCVDGQYGIVIAMTGIGFAGLVIESKISFNFLFNSFGLIWLLKITLDDNIITEIINIHDNLISQ